MRRALIMLVLAIFCATCGVLAGCDDDDGAPTAIDEISDIDDDTDAECDDDAIDDDDNNDDNDTDDDTIDDDDTSPLPDDYLAPWPQSNIETPDYDESPPAGPLRAKAVAYDDWYDQWHAPEYGGTLTAYFTDETRSTVDAYHHWADSCIWTSTYAVSQMMRYHVTAESEAKQQATRAVETLLDQADITDVPGLIARYYGPQEATHPGHVNWIYEGDQWCDLPEQERCYHIESGPYAGDFWWGGTSRDQYTGWLFAMSYAFDLLDDEDLRDRLATTVVRVLHELMDNHWLIKDPDGRPTDAAPNVLPSQQLVWLTIGYHVSGDQRIAAELKERLRNDFRLTLRIIGVNFLNRYLQYYGNNLGHMNWYTLLRLARVYFSDEDYQWFRAFFSDVEHSFARLSHNAWFTTVYMAVGDWEPISPEDPFAMQMVGDLEDFRDAPNFQYFLPDRDPATYELDILSVWMTDLVEAFPFLGDIMGEPEYQAKYAFPVPEQCSTDFLWQRNPFQIYECGRDRPQRVYPGVDYLVAYWAAAYHKFIDKDL
ncbi:MAG: hypothetical protein P9L99_16385 [Candidatus Lernaella stagnicola]|nr:hypothetical protein [Candidatus Lernaella stagnicola]